MHAPIERVASKDPHTLLSFCFLLICTWQWFFFGKREAKGDEERWGGGCVISLHSALIDDTRN